MNYLKIANHYDDCFKKYGPTHLGVDWPNYDDLLLRYNVMYELMTMGNESDIKNSSLLDFGCGFAGFMDWMLAKNKTIPSYAGLDINKSFYDYCVPKYPNSDFFNLDILVDNSIPEYDYIICNGTFTEKRELSYDDMLIFFKSAVEKLWNKTKKGMAFNVMSKIVDWERDDLFHVSFDDLAWFLKQNISRDFIIRSDYKLYEYTVYVYKK